MLNGTYVQIVSHRSLYCDPGPNRLHLIHSRLIDSYFQIVFNKSVVTLVRWCNAPGQLDSVSTI